MRLSISARRSSADLPGGGVYHIDQQCDLARKSQCLTSAPKLCRPAANCCCRSSRCRLSSASRAFLARISSLRDDILASSRDGLSASYAMLVKLCGARCCVRRNEVEAGILSHVIPVIKRWMFLAALNVKFLQILQDCVFIN